MLKSSASLAIFVMSISFPVKSASITATALWPEKYPQAGVGFVELDLARYESLKLCAFPTNTANERLLLGYVHLIFGEIGKRYGSRYFAEPTLSAEELYQNLRRSSRNAAESIEDFNGKNIPPPRTGQGFYYRNRQVPTRSRVDQPTVFTECDIFIGSEEEVLAVQETIYDRFEVNIQSGAPSGRLQTLSLGDLARRDQSYRLHRFETVESNQLLDTWAQVIHNYADFDSYSFVQKLSLTEQQLQQLSSFGVGGRDDYDRITARMSSTAYAGNTNVESVLQFLHDVAEYGSDSEASLKREEQNRRLAAEAREQEEQARERERIERARREEARARAREAREAREAQLAATHPYVARLSCSVAGTTTSIVRLEGCFVGSSSASHSRLRLTNEGRQQIFESLELYSAGTRHNYDELLIDLTPSFHIEAQNVGRNVTLGIEITDRRTGEVVYIDRVSQFGFINIRN